MQQRKAEWEAPKEARMVPREKAQIAYGETVRRRVDAGDPNAVATSQRTGGMEKYDRRPRWWMDHHDRLAAALV